jgi:hypothetical protein
MGATLAISFAVWGVATAMAAPQARAKVAAVSGAVEVYMSAFARWRPNVRAGQPLYLGDKVRTKPGATAKVTIFNAEGEDSVDLAPETMLEIPDVPENAQQVSWVGMFSEKLGQITAEVTPRAPPPGQTHSFNVRTPTVVAGVRGTNFNVDYDHMNRTSFVRLNRGILDGLTYGGLALGTFVKDQETAITALKVFRYASHLRNAQDFLGGNQDAVNRKYNLLFHMAEFSTYTVTLNGSPVGTDLWDKELPFEGPGVGPDNPMVLNTGSGHVILHLRHTGWFNLEKNTELSCYRLGNAVLMRLRKGKMHFHRMDPTYKALKYGPAMDVEVFLAQPDGTDLRVLDYTPKGGITRATYDMTQARGPRVEASKGYLKIMEVSR